VSEGGKGRREREEEIIEKHAGKKDNEEKIEKIRREKKEKR
jgi:hypothetical protein